MKNCNFADLEEGVADHETRLTAAEENIQGEFTYQATGNLVTYK